MTMIAVAAVVFGVLGLRSALVKRRTAILDAAIKKAGGSYDKATKTWTWKMGDTTVTRTLDEATTNYLADANYGEARKAACMEQAEEQLRVKAARAKASTALRCISSVRRSPSGVRYVPSDCQPGAPSRTGASGARFAPPVSSGRTVGPMERSAFG